MKDGLIARLDALNGLLVAGVVVVLIEVGTEGQFVRDPLMNAVVRLKVLSYQVLRALEKRQTQL